MIFRVSVHVNIKAIHPKPLDYWRLDDDSNTSRQDTENHAFFLATFFRLVYFLFPTVLPDVDDADELPSPDNAAYVFSMISGICLALTALFPA